MVTYDLIFVNGESTVTNIEDEVLPRENEIYEYHRQCKKFESFRVSEVRHRLIDSADGRSVFHEVYVSPLEQL